MERNTKRNKIYLLAQKLHKKHTHLYFVTNSNVLKNKDNPELFNHYKKLRQSHTQYRDLAYRALIFVDPDYFRDTYTEMQHTMFPQLNGSPSKEQRLIQLSKLQG